MLGAARHTAELCACLPIVKLPTFVGDALGHCTQAPDRSDAVSAVWAWIQMHLAVGLLEHWARLDDSSQASSHLAILSVLPLH